MNKFTVTLKQHTPLIHFQHDQEGATLRASEVKPKLDKFIIKFYFDDQFERCKHFLVGYSPKSENELRKKFETGYRALDYKLRISADNNSKKEYMIIAQDNRNIRDGELYTNGRHTGINVLGNTPYFAQEQLVKDVLEDPFIWSKGVNQKAENKDFKKGLVWDCTKLSFFSMNSHRLEKKCLIEIIKDQIESFFLATNFGSRSTKGFGGFTVDELNGVKKKWTEKMLLSLPCSFVYKKEMSDNTINDVQRVYKDAFSQIKIDYQKLKSGVNHNGYTKSILFCYAVDKMEGSPRWEKRYFKQQLQPMLWNVSSGGLYLKAKNAPIADSNGYKSRSGDYNYQYLRAVLGLAEQYEFQLNERMDKAVVKVNGGSVERSASPLIFKVLDGSIYIIGFEFNTQSAAQNILGKEVGFTFNLVRKGDKKNGSEKELEQMGKEQKLKTPSKFDLLDFMEYAMDKRKRHGQDLKYLKLK